MQMRKLLFALLLTLGSVAPAMAAVDLNLNLGAVPRMVAIPSSPVYYAPGLNTNYFFYDGLYWDFNGTDWYDSSWYNGPWELVDPLQVPSYLLQVPVSYYRAPPVFFGGWAPGAAPHWHEHWGSDWNHNRSGWDHSADGPFPRAPLPRYQRQYSGNRYPQGDQMYALHGQQYQYQPREPMVQQHYQNHGMQQGFQGGFGGQHGGGGGGQHGFQGGPGGQHGGGGGGGGQHGGGGGGGGGQHGGGGGGH
jgi:hypothetical protein